MKKLPLILVSAVCLSAGCIRIEQELVLKDDGSGTFDVEYSIAEQSITQINAMLKLEEQMARVAGDESIDPAAHERIRLFLSPDKGEIAGKLKEYEQHGITVDELTVTTRGARRHVHVNLLFRNIAEAAKADFFADYGFSLFRSPRGEYAIYRPPSVTQYQTDMDFSDAETVKLLSPLLGGFHFSLSMKMPGKVLRTTAHRKTFDTASWSFDFDRDANALVALQKQEFGLVFDGEGLGLPEIKLHEMPVSR